MKNNPARALLFLVLFLTTVFGAYTYTQNHAIKQKETLGVQDQSQPQQDDSTGNKNENTTQLRELVLSYPNTLELNQKQNSGTKFSSENESSWSLSGIIDQNQNPLSIDIIILSDLDAQKIQTFFECSANETTKCSDVAIQNITYKNIQTTSGEQTNIAYLTVKEEDLYVFTTDVDTSNVQDADRALQRVISGAHFQ